MKENTLYRQPSSLTIQQLIDKHKIILDIFFRQLAKVRLHHIHNFEQELKHHRSIDVLPGHGSYPHIAALGVEEACPGDVRDGRTNHASGMDNVYTKCINAVSSGMFKKNMM